MQAPETKTATRRTWGLLSVHSDNLSSWLPLLIIAVLLLVAPLLVSDFRLSLLGKFLTFAILAQALNLIWGYGGMLSLGHGVFFGLGGYSMAMFLKLEAAGGKLPDFMFWSGLEKLPFFWWPFQYAWFAFPMTLIVPAELGGGLGYLVFRSRITGVYFSLITRGLALIVSILFVGQAALHRRHQRHNQLQHHPGVPGLCPKHPIGLLLHQHCRPAGYLTYLPIYPGFPVRQTAGSDARRRKSRAFHGL